MRYNVGVSPKPKPAPRVLTHEDLAKLGLKLEDFTEDALDAETSEAILSALERGEEPPWPPGSDD